MAGAWRYAPLLPWRVQCPGCVCAALAAGSGGLGRCRVLCLPCFPLPAPRVAGRPVRMSLILARWYAIPCGLCVPQARSGCPSGIPRVPFVCVCARALAASAPPPPSPGWCGARTLRDAGAGRCQGRSTRSVPLRVSCLGPVLRLAFLGGGGGRPGPVSPYLAWSCALPVGWIRAWGPVTNPTARALASWLCALRARHQGGWGASCLGVKPVRTPVAIFGSLGVCI